MNTKHPIFTKTIFDNGIFESPLYKVIPMTNMNNNNSRDKEKKVLVLRQNEEENQTKRRLFQQIDNVTSSPIKKVLRGLPEWQYYHLT